MLSIRFPDVAVNHALPNSLLLSGVSSLTESPGNPIDRAGAECSYAPRTFQKCKAGFRPTLMQSTFSACGTNYLTLRLGTMTRGSEKGIIEYWLGCKDSSHNQGRCRCKCHNLLFRKHPLAAHPLLIDFLLLVCIFPAQSI